MRGWILDKLSYFLTFFVVVVIGIIGLIISTITFIWHGALIGGAIIWAVIGHFFAFLIIWISKGVFKKDLVFCGECFWIGYRRCADLKSGSGTRICPKCGYIVNPQDWE